MYRRLMRYLFHKLDGSEEPEVFGVECATVQDARRQAVHHASRSIGGWDGDELRVEVTDERGHLVTTVVLLSIDAKDKGEVIHVYRALDGEPKPDPMFVIGSGHASRRRKMGA